MDGSSVRRVRAIHPGWDGFLLLSTADNSVVHESHRSKGTYETSGAVLTIHWKKYGTESFVEVAGSYVHLDILKKSPALNGFKSVSIKDKTFKLSKLHLIIPGSNYEVGLRISTTDVPTFEQVFVRCDYESSEMPDSAATIVDLGANIGLATVFFGTKYPAAKILAVEPDEDNFALLTANTAALGSRVQKQPAAAWIKDGYINLHREDEQGHSLGAWGGQVSEAAGRSSRKTPCYKMTTLLENAGFDEVDILKVDIEGAELELFSQGAEEWLPRVKLVIVEMHERFRPGSNVAVFQALRPLFRQLPWSGENALFRRIE